MRVNSLEGQLLDFWVAKSEGRILLDAAPDANCYDFSNGFDWHPAVYRPSSNWAQGGALVANEWYDIETVLLDWFGADWPYLKTIADQPLKWFLRAFVASRFGNEVEDPEHLDLPLLSAEMPSLTPPSVNGLWPLDGKQSNSR